jgi:Holliday junction resolvase
MVRGDQVHAVCSFAQRFLDRPYYAIRPGRSRRGAAAG